MNGILVLDKPAGMSSASAVDHVRRATGADRAGHGGTLDPLATGVLAVCLGHGTKLAQYLLADDKAYEATGLLGVETDTLDRTGVITSERPVAVTREALLAAIAERLGEQDQVPPMYSAIKQDGVRLYKRARRGEEVERVARRIRVDRLELLAFEPPRFRVAIACSKGTYVRSLVADLGTAVGCGANLLELRRTRSGRFSIAQALTMDQVRAIDVAPHLVAMTLATDLPHVPVAADLIGKIRSGLQLPVEAFTAANLERFMLVGPGDELLAIAHGEEGKTVYDRVFPA